MTCVIEREIKELVKVVIAEYYQNTNHTEPVFIKIKAAAEICACSRSIIDDLVQGAPDNGFPVVKLSSKTFRIDKSELYRWLQNGGLKNTGT